MWICLVIVSPPVSSYLYFWMLFTETIWGSKLHYVPLRIIFICFCEVSSNPKPSESKFKAWKLRLQPLRKLIYFWLPLLLGYSPVGSIPLMKNWTVTFVSLVLWCCQNHSSFSVASSELVNTIQGKNNYKRAPHLPVFWSSLISQPLLSCKLFDNFKKGF